MSHAGERVVVEEYRSTPAEYLIYLFHRLSYAFAGRFAEGREVLDYGCGSGFGAAEIARVASRVVGVDVSAAALEHARARFAAPGLEFARIEAERPLPFAARSFDTVLSFQVIEHVRDADLHLREARRVLRPGGCLVLATPDRRTRLLPGQRPWNRWHRTEYGAARLRRRLERHFDRVEMLGMSGRPEVLGIELRRTRRARWLTLPATLPLYPDRLRVGLLGGFQRLRGRRASEPPVEPRELGFDESALRIGAGVRPSVNHVAVAWR